MFEGNNHDPSKMEGNLSKKTLPTTKGQEPWRDGKRFLNEKKKFKDALSSK